MNDNEKKFGIFRYNLPHVLKALETKTANKEDSTNCSSKKKKTILV